MLVTVIGIAAAAVTVVAAIVAWRQAVEPRRRAARQGSVEQFQRIRRHLKLNIAELTTLSLGEHQRFRGDRELPVLTREHWIPSAPLPLDSVPLRLEPQADGDSTAEAAAKVRALLPFGRDRLGDLSYSEAIGLYDPPAIWFDSASYRLLGCTAKRAPGGGANELELSFQVARYFDAQDTSEFLAYELASQSEQQKPTLTGGPYRRWLADPFDFSRRCAVPGVNALTVRCSGAGAFFFMHHRDAGKVAVSMNTDHVTPAGEFQPHDDILPIWQTDLNIWHTVMREYAEEFLGRKDSAGQSGLIIDYDHDDPYRQLEAARRRGDVIIRFLGLGLDPVSWKPEIAVACVWKARAFDRIFRTMGSVNPEGLLITGKRVGGRPEGVPFSEANVLGYARSATTLAGGRMCLTLAWRWREALGIPQVPGPRPAGLR
jgi:hypothetical protein